ncbi:MAG: hypothetical protein IID36_02505 [Planctomycetes bacterium]|nr:hypothetical protein [Planctomycetota bacterium]
MKQLGSIVRSVWTRSYRGRLVVCFMVVHACGMLTGCGVSMFNPVDVGGSASLRSDFGELGTPDVFVLDWTGGSSMLYADVELAPVDFDAFATSDGGTLADDSDALMEAVRERVAKILDDVATYGVTVVNGESDEVDAVTIVHIAQEISPDAPKEIGRAEYDPCDRQQDNAAVIFAERIAQLGGIYTVEEWISVFANVIAHEIAHTLGFGHIERSTDDLSERSLYVELMLDGHTMDEMRGAQRFLHAQTNCSDAPDGTDETSYITLAACETFAQSDQR